MEIQTEEDFEGFVYFLWNIITNYGKVSTAWVATGASYLAQGLNSRWAHLSCYLFIFKND